MAGSTAIEAVTDLISKWDEADSTGGRITEILISLAEIFEVATQDFYKLDPDPFDDRHPSRSQPDCTLGHILKDVFQHPRMVDELVKVYILRDDDELSTAICRFLLNLLPGLENVIFHEEYFVFKLFKWTELASDPLQSYATGLLAAAMENPDIAVKWREMNAYLVPLMLKRLYEASKGYLKDTSNSYFPGAKENNSSESKSRKPNRKCSKKNKVNAKSVRYNPIQSHKKDKENNSCLKISSVNDQISSVNDQISPVNDQISPVNDQISPVNDQISPVNESILNESSSSAWWTENMLGTCAVHPLTRASQQRYIIQYLTPMGEYQELIGHVFEEGALSLILRYIDLKQNPDVRLAFDALKYLASLLNHKKIAFEFLNIGGLELLLKVPRSSIAAAGVSFVLYYLGYLEEVLEKICMFSPEIISDLVSYALWLLECSHDSSRCHATLFFGYALRFKSILEHFDEQDGLRKLFNVMSTLEIFVGREARVSLTDDEIYGDRITTKHVCASLKRYFEAHLAVLVEEKQKNIESSSSILTKSYQNEVLMCEAVEKNIEFLHDLALIPLYDWKPVICFVKLDGITFLLELISYYIETTPLGSSGRFETLKHALDVLKVCALSSAAQIKFCEKVSVHLSAVNCKHATGFGILLQATQYETPSAEVQRAALCTIINCVCAKIPNGETGSRLLTEKKRREELLNKIWKAVRSKNGIIVLINLLSVKVPITEADALRALACRALCELARSQNVQQIISKIPLFTDGQLTDLMKEPVLQDKYHYHVQFCKYGLELLERVTGAPLSTTTESLDVNKLTNSEVVTKTKIVYKEDQLLQLISDHLARKDIPESVQRRKRNAISFHQTISCLQKEMEEKNIRSKTQRYCPISPVANGSMHRPLPRSFCPDEISIKKSNTSSPSVVCAVPFIPPPSVPLKIMKKFPIQSYRSPQRRLQKLQISSGSYVQSPALAKRQSSSMSLQPTNSLHSIVTEYLRKQHSMCKNPVLPCPPFDLFKPHKCPEPQNMNFASANCVLRLQKREMSFENGGYQGASFNTKHIFNRFRMYCTFRDEDDGNDLNTCEFYRYKNEFHQKLLVGTDNGILQAINIHNGKRLFSRDIHIRGIDHIESNKKTPLFITSGATRVGTTSIWKFAESPCAVVQDIQSVHSFYEVAYMEFGKRSVDKAIGTKPSAAYLYDLNTMSEIQNFPTGDMGNDYLKNTATLDYLDELVLSDGIIYDVRSGKMVHKLDKFNSIMNGVFHPNGREIISNSEIWDIRTFKLLRSVVGLDACRVTFNDLGNVFYAVTFKDGRTAGKMNCFYTFDAQNYNIISTVDVKRPIFHITTDPNDKYVCTLEAVNCLDYVCRFYEIGRTKQVGDENGDESEESTEDEVEVEEEESDDSDDGEGQASEVQMELEDNDDDDDELSWLTEESSSDDDNEALFAINTSTIDD